MRSRYVFPRHTEADPPVAVAGDGCYVIDAEGRRYLDACGGPRCRASDTVTEP